MFDLNQAIDNWREQFTHEPIAEADLIELEDHLRSEINDLNCRGLTEEEAFIMGKHRLGENFSLGQEYIKTNPWPKWRQRFFWASAGILGFNVISSTARIIANGAGIVAMFLGAQGTSLGIIQLIMHFFSLVGLLAMTAVMLSQSRVSARHLRSNWAIGGISLITLIVILSSQALGVGTNILRARIMGAEAMGAMALAQSYGYLALTILQPLFFTVLLLILWPRQRSSTV